MGLPFRRCAVTHSFPAKYMLAFDFADGSVFVGESMNPEVYIRALMREWRSDERPVVRIVSLYFDPDRGRGYNLYGKYVARYPAMLAGKVVRARGLDEHGLPQTYASGDINFVPDVIEAAGSTSWGCGDLLLIDGVTSKPESPRIPVPTRLNSWVLIACGIGLAAGAALYISSGVRPILDSEGAHDD